MSFNKGDRVRFVFACPTAPPVHEEYIGLTGVIEEIRPYVPTIKNVWGQDINNPHGNISVKLDRGHVPFQNGMGSFSVMYVFSWELEKI